ncbi:MAG: hypothetical protein IJY59_03475, partial [Bacteroidaceae bacterium]|nr:hypothetical protein [Bacteroidaceae bacterium]
MFEPINVSVSDVLKRFVNIAGDDRGSCLAGSHDRGLSTLSSFLIGHPLNRYYRLEFLVPLADGASDLDTFIEVIPSPEPTVPMAMATGDTVEFFPFCRMFLREQW